MEPQPQTPVSRKRSERSPSSEFKDVEILPISPPMNSSSKPNSSKQKEVMSLDADMEEDSCGDVMLTDKSGKGKEVLSNSAEVLCNLENEESGSDMQTPNNGIVDDCDSDLYDEEDEEDEWTTYQDDMDYSKDLEPNFDDMDIPTGVEASFPWLPGGPSNNSNTTSTSPTKKTESNVPTPTLIEQRIVDVILQNFDLLIKRFDTVEDHSDHHFCKFASSETKAPKSWPKRIQEEWKILERDLPDKIFVRVYESRMDLLRAVIIGAEGTPYHDGLFFFDVFFPSSYPDVPPQVHYHSGGLRINPNLYVCGKVCLSLLNTWHGSKEEMWNPKLSTMLQVLVSIQGMILNAKPYFNEPGYTSWRGTAKGEKASLDYNERTFIYNLKTMVYSMRKPPKHFEDFVVGHFCKHARDILISCKAYLEGAELCSLTEGAVSEVQKGGEGCSPVFKASLAGFITTLVNTFSGIGAKDCEEFLSLAEKASGQVTPHWPDDIYD